MDGLSLAAAFADLAPSAAVAGAVALVVTLAILRLPNLHRWFSRGATTASPHHDHSVDLPRIGGVAILCGFLCGLAHLLAVRGEAPDRAVLAVVAALLPIAGCGIAEDLTRRVGAGQRLCWMFAAALCVSGSGMLVLQRTDVPPLDALLAVTPIAVLFTAFACVGAANAFNLVDGLDGMLGGIAMLTLAAIFTVAHAVGDRAVWSTAGLLAVALLGWMPFNWPRAVMFSGDGGAYAIGFLCAALLLLLVIRHPSVSPWFGLTAAALPIWETLYSIWRRVRIGQSSLAADRGHLHHLLRARMKGAGAAGGRREPGTGGAPTDARSAPAMDGPNGYASPVLWLLHGAAATAGAVHYDDTSAQLVIFTLFVLTYALAYRVLLWAGRTAHTPVAH